MKRPLLVAASIVLTLCILANIMFLLYNILRLMERQNDIMLDVKHLNTTRNDILEETLKKQKNFFTFIQELDYETEK